MADLFFLLCCRIEPRPGVEPETELPEWPEGADLRLCNETFSNWFGKHRELFGMRGHWCMFQGIYHLHAHGYLD